MKSDVKSNVVQDSLDGDDEDLDKDSNHAQRSLQSVDLLRQIEQPTDYISECCNIKLCN